MKAWLSIALVLAGCAAAPVAPSPEGEAADSFRFIGGGASMTARLLRPDYLWSATGEVQHFPDGYRGRWRGESVDLRTSEGKIDGFVGGQRTELHLEAKPDGYVLRGMYRGHLGELWVGAHAIEGSVGYGWISVARVSPGEYQGIMPTRPGGGRYLRALSVPVVFDALPPEQQALYLALLIGA